MLSVSLASLTLTDSSPKKIVWRLSPEVLRCVGKAEAKISDLINQVCAIL
jgi:hypothetical protein